MTLTPHDVRRVFRRVLHEQPEEISVHRPEHNFIAGAQPAYILERVDFGTPPQAERADYLVAFKPTGIWPYYVRLVTTTTLEFAQKNKRVVLSPPSDTDPATNILRVVAFTYPGHYYPAKTLVLVSRDSQGIYWIQPHGMKMLHFYLTVDPNASDYTNLRAGDISDQLGNGYVLHLGTNPDAIVARIAPAAAGFVELKKNHRHIAVWLSENKYKAIQRTC